LQQIALNTLETQIEIDLSNFKNGVYLYSLYLKEEIFATKRMVLTK